jgi:hypothetical protein
MRTSVFLALMPFLVYGAGDCLPPPAKVSKLKAYLSYRSRWGVGRPGPRRFSFAAVGDSGLFLQREAEPYAAPGDRVVYSMQDGSPVITMGCQADSTWTQCGLKALRESLKALGPLAMTTETPSVVSGGPAVPTCDLLITVPKWHPSPDSALKRKLASEVLQEVLTSFFVVQPKSVYAGNFNVDDPDLTFYIVDAEGHDDFQGCLFEASRHPHCSWHLFGQSPVESIKRGVMANPYQLLPSGTSKNSK